MAPWSGADTPAAILGDNDLLARANVVHAHHQARELDYSEAHATPAAGITPLQS